MVKTLEGVKFDQCIDILVTLFCKPTNKQCCHIGLKVGQIGNKWDKSGILNILARRSDVKWCRICPI